MVRNNNPKDVCQKDTIVDKYDTKEERLGELKEKVNNFLFPLMPNKMTIEEFEQFAITINNLIESKWEI